MSALPSARVVRDVLGHVDIGAFRVTRNPSDQQQDSVYLWQVRGPKDVDGCREVLDEHRTYREAVTDARKRDRARTVKSRGDYVHLRFSATDLLKAIDDVIPTLLAAYERTTGPTLEEMNETLWTLINAACNARGQKTPKRLPEHWEPTMEPGGDPHG